MDPTVVYETVATWVALGVGKEVAEGVGGGLISGALARIRKVFGADRRAVAALEEARNAASPKAIEQLAAALQWHAQEDRDFAADLVRWADEAGPEIHQRVQAGRDAFVAGGNQVIKFGGEGGNAPGASGGGGAAFGPGAVGGPGGPVGRIDLGGEAGQEPGAGGGGSGWLAPDSPLLSQASSLSPTEGVAEFLGYDGPDGGDTTFGLADGTVMLRAAGGKGALAGTGIRSTSDTLAVSTLMPANSLDIRNDLAFVLGGAWEWYSILNFPATVRIVILMVLEASGVPTGEYTINLEARDPFDHVAGSVKFAIGVSQPGDILRRSFSVPFEVTITSTGIWSFSVLHGDRVLARIPLHFKRGV